MSAELLDTADRGLADTVVHLARHAHGGATEERDGLVLFAGAHNYPGAYCNGILRLDRATQPETAVARARAFFVPLRRNFTVWTRVDADQDLIELCQASGWDERPPSEGMPIIVLRSAPGAGPEGTPEATEIVTRDDADAYVTIVADAYGMADAPVSLQRAIFFSPESVLAEDAIGMLVRSEGRPAAGTMVVRRRGVACHMWTGTATWARGRGAGPASARATVNAAFAAGDRLVVAQSSQMGLRHWLAMGYEVIGSYRRFMAPAAS
jgi:hypothetical protein